MKLASQEADILFARNTTFCTRGRSKRVKQAVNRRKRREERRELRDHIADTRKMAGEEA